MGQRLYSRLQSLHGKSAPPCRRESPRWRVYLPCKFSYGEETKSAKIVDLSTGGALLECKDIPAEGCQIELVIQVPKREFRFKAMTVHSGWFLKESRSFHAFGVQFHRLSESQRDILKQLLTFSPGLSPRKYALEL
ncbi:MAG: PilZ domain-containing protein [Acidobacteriota bacterium]